MAKSCCVGLQSGRLFDVLNPDPRLIDISDIAMALAKTARFGGRNPGLGIYSVARHCINAAKVAPIGWELEALLHDAAEAYVGDVVSPIKRELGEAFASIEEGVMRAICHALMVPYSRITSPVVVSVDRQMLAIEMDYIMGLVEYAGDWAGPPIGCHSVAEDYAAFMALYCGFKDL